MDKEKEAKKRKLLYISLGVLLVVVFVWSLMPKATLVDMAEIKVAPFEETIVEDARTRIKEKYIVSSPVDGILTRIKLEPGDVVEKGQKISFILWETD